jgi:hypothetical protein
MKRLPNHLLMRVGLFTVVVLSALMIGHYVSREDDGLATSLNLGLSLFNFFGAIMLLQLDR